MNNLVGTTKISSTTAIFMVVVAALIDLIEFLLTIIVIGVVVNIFINIFTWLLFFLWLKIKGVDFISPKRVLAFNGGFLVELIPVLNALPAWTLAIVLTLMTVWAEEKASRIIPGGEKLVKTISKTK